LYFTLYGATHAQMLMLQDEHRMRAFDAGIAATCRGKVVLDVGAGSGVLSVFAARAGASRVYAVEGSAAAAAVARSLVAAANLTSVVTVLHAVAEDVRLPEQVDVLVSEWMGYMLFEEGMVDTVLRMRDRWLKPGGLMLPGHARLFAGLAAPGLPEPPGDLQPQRMPDHFIADMRQKYDLDFSHPPAPPDQPRTRWINGELNEDALCGPPVEIARFDMLRLEVADLMELRMEGELPGCPDAPALAVWFDVALAAGVNLTTGPGSQSHWHQTLFWLPRPVTSPEGVVLPALIRMRRNPDWWRHHDVRVELPGMAQDYPASTVMWMHSHGNYHPINYMYR
jgi:SAM-dependent methyltransferase